MDIYEKESKLKEHLRSLGRVAVAFSGGVDSTYLLHVAKEVLGDNVVAVTAHSEMMPMRDRSDADDFCGREKIKQIHVRVRPLDNPKFAANPPDKCYHCKKDVYGEIIKAADGAQVIEGTNVSDEGDYRPGMKAVKEMGVLSPLKDASMTKDDIRLLSKERGLKTWSKPAFACLASRFAYGSPITAEAAAMVDAAENYIFDMGISQARVRVHGDVARIEVEPQNIVVMAERAEEICEYLTELGFRYVTLDLGGYRMGSMNRMLEGNGEQDR